MDLSKLRNLGVVAHIDAGKTTVSEYVLHCTGVEHRVGRVDEGTAVMDWMAEERERGITITAAATRVQWKGVDFNLIDTPGHVDFTVEVERCMRVLDGSVLVIDAVAGVQAQSETVWRQMRRHAVPCVVFVNKCDRVGADFLAATQTLRDRLQAPAVPVQYPIYEDGELRGVVDCIEGRAWSFTKGEAPAPIEMPAGLADEVGVLRSELVDALADGDDAILQAVLEDTELDAGTLRAALRKRTIDFTLVPVLCGAALRGVGVEPLLDAVVDYLPSPLEVPPITGFDHEGEPKNGNGPDPAAPLAALAFKLHAGPHGDLTFVRVYEGTLRTGVKLWNPRVRRMERASRILRVHADGGDSLDEAVAGDIVGLTGLKLTVTGDTLCDRADPISLEPPEFPEPVIRLVVEPSSSADRDKLRSALDRMAHEDPSFRVREDESAGQWTIEGMGELHLEVQLHRLESEFHVESRVGQPRVSYRESVAEGGRGSGRVERMLGGKDVFGAVDVEFVAAPGDHAPRVEWHTDDVPDAFRPTVEEALVLEAQSGPRFGYPIVGGIVRVIGGESHSDRDAEAAFGQAAILAVRAALEKARIVLLEPRMAFDIQSPEEFASGIIADLGSRRAEVGDVVAEGDERIVTGVVPLAQMFGYSTAVRSLSQGRASFSMTPSGFIEVPEEELEARGLTWA
ncbi:MAG: elongation factor G [bacterium]|nr:elongation factor G [bacterium]